MTLSTKPSTKPDLKPQILFDQPEQSTPASLQPQQAFTEDERWLADDAAPSELEQGVIRALRPRRRRPWLLCGLSLVSALALWQLLDGLIGLWPQQPLLATGWGVGLGVLMLGAGRAGVREWRLLRRLKRAEGLQQQAQQLLQRHDTGNAAAYCEQLARRSGVEQCDGYRAWVAALRDVHSDREVLALYESCVLAQVDRQARKEVGRWSAEAALLVAISPLASVDMLLMLWRNLKMVERIARLYGIELGYFSRVRLLRQLVLNLVYAGASELLVDVGPDLLGAELAGKLSARVAQGVGAGLMTARLGIKTMQLCRPLPFSETTRPRLNLIRKELLAHVRRQLGRAKGGEG